MLKLPDACVARSSPARRILRGPTIGLSFPEGDEENAFPCAACFSGGP